LQNQTTIDIPIEMKRLKPLLIFFSLSGFFWACETTDPLIGEVQVYMLTGEYGEALAVVDAAIEEDEEDEENENEDN
jgi:hypothetical protein